MTKGELLALVASERARLDAAVEGLRRNALLEEALPDGRTGKDILAHLTWYEREMVGVLRERALVGSDLWGVPQPERNAVIHSENRDRPLDEVLLDYARVHEELEGLLEGLEEPELHDAARFREMPPEWPPWEVFADNTYEHYAGHLPEFERLAQKGSAER
ncbi:MAG: DinB family protein [Candidatus Eisenbacteria bacterium]